MENSGGLGVNPCLLLGEVGVFFGGKTGECLTFDPSRLFGKPILRTWKPTVYPHCVLKTRKEIRGSGDVQIRMLRADEAEALRDGGSFRESNVIQFDTLLQTGMRYIEVQRLHDHPGWFDGNFIYLPKEAVLKSWRVQKERNVRLTPRGREAVAKFFTVKNLPGGETWKENLQRWALKVGLDPVGLGPKTTRKTWESWLMVTYPERFLEVVQSQGHDVATSLNHYLNMPFTEQDKVRMKVWLDGFF